VASIYVIAGVNGAGKSSIAGAAFETYFNPDDAARRILAANPGMTITEANSEAWQEGKRQLERAIREDGSYAFETTLGGRTIASLLREAAASGKQVWVWYTGLASPDLHIERVRARVKKGGHDIPEEKIRERYESSRLNLIELLPYLAGLRMFDNSRHADPDAGARPEPQLLLQMTGGRVVSTCDLQATPEWAKPILAAALKLGMAG
jgi:predicted ABC-type ATPase